MAWPLNMNLIHWSHNECIFTVDVQLMTLTQGGRWKTPGTMKPRKTYCAYNFNQGLGAMAN